MRRRAAAVNVGWTDEKQGYVTKEIESGAETNGCRRETQVRRRARAGSQCVLPGRPHDNVDGMVGWQSWARSGWLYQRALLSHGRAHAQTE